MQGPPCGPPGTHPSLEQRRGVAVDAQGGEGAVVGLHRDVSELGLLVKKDAGLLEHHLHLAQLGVGPEQLLCVVIQLQQLLLLLLEVRLRAQASMVGGVVGGSHACMHGRHGLRRAPACGGDAANWSTASGGRTSISSK